MFAVEGNGGARPVVHGPHAVSVVHGPDAVSVVHGAATTAAPVESPALGGGVPREEAEAAAIRAPLGPVFAVVGSVPRLAMRPDEWIRLLHASDFCLQGLSSGFDDAGDEGGAMRA